MIKINDIYATKPDTNELYRVIKTSGSTIVFRYIKDYRETNIDWITKNDGHLVDMDGHPLIKLTNPPIIKPRITVAEFNHKYEPIHLIVQTTHGEFAIIETDPQRPEEKIIMTRDLNKQHKPRVTEIGRIFIQDHNLNFNELLADVQYLD